MWFGDKGEFREMVGMGRLGSCFTCNKEYNVPKSYLSPVLGGGQAVT